MPYIYLQPIGEIKRVILDDLSPALEKRYNLPCRIRESIDIPTPAYNKSRDQYHSTTILNIINKNIPSDAERILGIIDKDLYVPELNFVFGEAMPFYGTAIISITRLRQEYYGLPKNNRIFKERMVKEAVHELGHTYGLDHCHNPKCVMFFSNSLADTDRKGDNLCGSCKSQIKGK